MANYIGICEYCGREFIRVSKGKKYCTRECFGLANAEKRNTAKANKVIDSGNEIDESKFEDMVFSKDISDQYKNKKDFCTFMNEDVIKSAYEKLDSDEKRAIDTVIKNIEKRGYNGKAFRNISSASIRELIVKTYLYVYHGKELKKYKRMYIGV